MSMYRAWQQFFKYLSIFSVLITLALLIYLIKGLGILQNPDALAQALEKQMLLGSLLFFALQVIQVVIPIIPGGVTTIVGFMAFGPFWGFVLNYLGILLGSVILFLLSRHFGKMFILLFINEQAFDRYERKLLTPTYEKFFILNMISPVSPADVLVMITGLGRMSFRKFFIIILLCKPLSIIVYSYFWIYGGKLLFK